MLDCAIFAAYLVSRSAYFFFTLSFWPSRICLRFSLALVCLSMPAMLQEFTSSRCIRKNCLSSSLLIMLRTLLEEMSKSFFRQSLNFSCLTLSFCSFDFRFFFSKMYCRCTFLSFLIQESERCDGIRARFQTSPMASQVSL